MCNLFNCKNTFSLALGKFWTHGVVKSKNKTKKHLKHPQFSNLEEKKASQMPAGRSIIPGSPPFPLSPDTPENLGAIKYRRSQNQLPKHSPPTTRTRTHTSFNPDSHHYLLQLTSPCPLHPLSELYCPFLYCINPYFLTHGYFYKVTL